ncbi:hypothetical protein NDK47_03145 [Brevibacillus ruminantium]|uniref:PrgI family protein n=1 Tax=Brevibacillus ruminantium TaxID=2950604 RepID=A0ABY4WGU5_9BACL|nr:hypothetical protein [Brevibacillus ruminantium]USG66342.1 hypothetical protein NDK47_03145 [Brevibacillus ruminantium]
MKKQDNEILYQEESGYKDLLLRKSMKMRLTETLAFVVGMLMLSQFFNTRTDVFKVMAFAIAIAVVGLAPFLYKSLLRPSYKLSKTHLIVTISGQETRYPLSEVEPIFEGRHLYRLSGKRESLMVSRQFLSKLNEQLFLYQKGKKRR